MSHGPLFRELVRLQVAAGLRRQHGYGIMDARELSYSLTDKMIDANLDDGMAGAIGDGTIIKAIIEFLNSPTGQALIQALINLLIGML